MSKVQRVRPSLAIALLIAALSSLACTTGRTVPLQAQAAPGAPGPRSGLKAGDRLRVHTRDGRHKDLNLDHVSAQGDVFGQQQEHVGAADITKVERRSINKVRTTLLLTGVGVSVFFLIAIVAFASGDFY
jgi:hypothetical protein